MTRRHRRRQLVTYISVIVILGFLTAAFRLASLAADANSAVTIPQQVSGITKKITFKMVNHQNEAVITNPVKIHLIGKTCVAPNTASANSSGGCFSVGGKNDEINSDYTLSANSSGKFVDSFYVASLKKTISGKEKTEYYLVHDTSKVGVLLKKYQIMSYDGKVLRTLNVKFPMAKTAVGASAYELITDEELTIRVRILPPKINYMEQEQKAKEVAAGTATQTGTSSGSETNSNPANSQTGNKVDVSKCQGKTIPTGTYSKGGVSITNDCTGVSGSYTKGNTSVNYTKGTGVTATYDTKYGSVSVGKGGITAGKYTIKWGR